jgi:hypothetical protein
VQVQGRGRQDWGQNLRRQGQRRLVIEGLGKGRELLLGEDGEVGWGGGGGGELGRDRFLVTAAFAFAVEDGKLFFVL